MIIKILATAGLFSIAAFVVIAMSGFGGWRIALTEAAKEAFKVFIFASTMMVIAWLAIYIWADVPPLF